MNNGIPLETGAQGASGGESRGPGTATGAPVKFRPRWFYRERMIQRRIEYLLAKRTLHRLIHAELRAMGLRDKRVRVELRAAQMRLASTK